MAVANSRRSLLSLPDELLDTIIHEARDDEANLSHLLICRRILPFARRALYQTIVLEQPRRQRPLARTLVRDPYLRGLVKILVLHRSLHSTAEACERQHALLSLVTSIKHLYLYDYSATLTAALAKDSSWSKSWSKLATFSLYAADSGNDVSLNQGGNANPIVVAFWRMMSLFPALEHVAISTPGFGLDYFPTNASLTAPLRSLQSLHVSGFSHARPAAHQLPDLAAMMPTLRELSLTAQPRGRVSLPSPPDSILDKAPTTLTHLTIRHQHVGANLQRFPALTFLDLGCASFDPDTILPSLLSAPLTEIIFGSGAPVSPSLLRGLVIHSTILRRLTLNYDRRPPRGDALQKLFKSLSTRNVEPFISGVAEVRQSSRPKWTFCSAADLREIVSLAADRNIDVTGSALVCLDWEAFFDDEATAYLIRLARSARDAERTDAVGQALVRRAVVNDDLGPLRRHLGREGALQAFKRHRPSLYTFFEDSFGPDSTDGASTAGSGLPSGVSVDVNGGL